MTSRPPHPSTNPSFFFVCLLVSIFFETIMFCLAHIQDRVVRVCVAASLAPPLTINNTRCVPQLFFLHARHCTAAASLHARILLKPKTKKSARLTSAWVAGLYIQLIASFFPGKIIWSLASSSSTNIELFLRGKYTNGAWTCHGCSLWCLNLKNTSNWF